MAEADGHTTGGALTLLRFTGGPLDGRELASGGAAELYRMAGGEYRARTDDGSCAVVYLWHPDTGAGWHDAGPGGSALLP